ncbi:CHAT domain-containing protein [Flavilitoribacter nigricans]|uniref:CHAT domain-containing protein n=1 Tax=Flavilitoribacter nigricans (strain ATCC 23147 / DSM 23189 / NBRC 102662 / NCIMB 1420 / SS-2) TaxID=1122177 RepID=A0A2D0NBV8_FLAN2|nr:CHAT domain-containing protein [Flavilitoribacter nigricans]PHN05858.1 hypothetical protein CRP01_15420 [Flavilitoribacter nigricans DSM 23189 = NBRC 102662]
MTQPILYFTFANQEDDHLPQLKREMDELKEILRPLESREFIKLEREESATTQDIIRTLSAYPDRVSIFHYAGHADGAGLELEAGAGQAKGLAKLLGEQTGLQLVFLNGCSTQGQVKQLFEAGVKAVIATSVPIGDEKAVQFAAAFYRALANKRSIKLAFEFAKAAVETEYRDSPDFRIQRGMGLEGADAEDIDVLPWVLYVQPQSAEEVLAWRLPYYREVGLPNHMIQFIGQQFKVNRYIVLVLDEMCRYNKDIYSQMVEIRDGEEVKKDSSTYLDLVIQNFPWLIGSQIQLLRQFNRPGRERLEQLQSTYLLTGITLYYILLSDLWDTKRRLGFELPPAISAEVRQNRSGLLTKDFLQAFADLAVIMESQGAEYFIPEMRHFHALLSDRESHLHKAWKYLEKVRTGMDAIPEDEFEKTCLRAEQALAVLLQKAAFLADYRMLTVRNISIDNPRYGEETYELNFGALNAIVSTSLSLYEDSEKRRKENYSNCKSIVLTPDENDLSHALNLSPFVIDKNTFLQNEHIDLFFFGFHEGEHYHYLAVKHSIFLALANEKGTDIIDTNMSMADFAEGRNIKNPITEEEDFGFGDAFGFRESGTAAVESPKVFTLLETQFEQLFTDLAP